MWFFCLIVKLCEFVFFVWVVSGVVYFVVKV